MGITSLQACMDPAGWLQEVIQEERAMGSPPLEDMISCSRPLLERRLRPQPDPSLKCPRCDSTHTKFCYYNNYSLSQPRYFCKTCRRYWTKGGSLRNVPVGGGCRKNKRVSVKKLDPQPLNSMNPSIHLLPSSSSSIIQHDLTDLNLSFTGVHAQISHQDAPLMENIRNSDFNMLANHRSNDLTVGDLGFTEGISYHHPHEFLNPNGFAINDGLIHGSSNLGYLQTSDTMGFAYGEGVDAEIKPRMLNMFNEGLNSSNIKAEDPSKRLLSLEWQDNNNYNGGNSTTESSSSAYLASLSCFMNNYGLFPLN